MPGGGTRTFHFSTGGGPGGGFNFNNPEDIFAEFMRQQSGGMHGDEDMPGIFSSFGSGGGSRSGRTRMRSSGFGEARQREHTPEISTVERPLPLSLEELYNGVTKKMKIKRKTFDETGKRVQTDQILEVPIKPGLKKGSKIKFNGVGDQVEGGRQDLHFIVEEVRTISFPITFLRRLITNCLIEGACPLQARRQRPYPHRGSGPQGSPHWVEENRHHHRRQANQPGQEWADATWKRRSVPRPGHAHLQEARSAG